MSKAFLAVGAFLLVLNIAGLPASLAASSATQMFPPKNCSPSKPLMAWDGNGDTFCMAIPTCAPGTYLTSVSAGVLSCAALPIPTCKSNETLTSTGPGTFSCVALSLPTCRANEVLTSTSEGTFSCVALTFPTCKSNEALTSTRPGTFACVALPEGSTKTIDNTVTKIIDNTSTKTEIVYVDRPQSGPVCTAYAEVCQAYQEQLRRLPDASGAAYYQSMIDAIRRDNLGISSAVLVEMVGRAIQHTLNNHKAGEVIAGVADSAAGISACTGSMNCSTLPPVDSESVEAALAAANYDGPSATQALVGASGTAVTLTQSDSGAAAQQARHIATIQSLYQNIVGRAGDDAGVAYWLAKINAGIPLAEIERGFLEACVQFAGTAYACKR